MDKKISIVITTYKRNPQVVSRAVQSVMKQTYQNTEIIVVDDSPPDYTERVNVESAINQIEDDRIRYIQHEKNKGACAARNTGLHAANGTYIAFLDDDDEWLEYKLEAQLKEFKNNKIALVYCNAQKVYVSQQRTEPIKDMMVGYTGQVFDRLIRSNFIGSTSFPLLDREKLCEIGGFDVDMPAFQDWDVWLRLMRHYEAGFTSKVCVNYYVHPGERISTNTQKRVAAMERIMKKYNEVLQNDKGIKIRMLNYYKTLLIYNGDLRKAWSCYKSILKLQPFSILHNARMALTFGRAVVKKKGI